MRRRALWREKPENPTGWWSFSSETLPSLGESSLSPFHTMDSAKIYVDKFKSFVILFFTPILLLPLIILVPDKFARCAFVIILMAVYWCTDVIPVAITSLLPVLLFPLLKVLDSKQVCIQYMKDTNMLFVGSLIMASAVEHWRLHKRIALRMLLLVGTQPSRLMLGFMFVTAFLSMWISNTAATAMMVPIVEAMMQQIVAAKAAAEASQGTLELLDKKAKKLPGQQVVLEDLTMQKQEDEEAKNMYKAMNLCVCYAASIGGTATLTGTGPNVVLLGQMQELFPDSKDVMNYASWFGFAFPNMLLMLMLAWLWLLFLYMRRNFKKTCICCEKKKRRSTENAAYKVLIEEYKKLGPLSYPECNVLFCFTLLITLWFSRDPGFMPGWLSIAWVEGHTKHITDATVAIFVAILLFIIPSEKPKFNFRNQTEEEKKTPFYPPPLLDWKVTQDKVPWGIVLLLGGGFAMAKGCETSGLSEWMARKMEPLSSVKPALITLILSSVISVITECTSNIATTTLFLPIFASMARSIGIHPLYVMIPCTLSASLAFMLPVATPPNAIVFAYGHLKIIDMVKTGFILNFLGVLTVSLSVNTWGRAVFNLGQFPDWANSSSIRT
ncbi:solute carrier family 13 member 5 isoform X2 [Mastomys coucha]|uniref:solute carrier family 13 member 5 isoform X2 n=1 Tax=Mastomys coucha TaxID=35658 RepID=UPI001261B4F3|nr:solute carrier family 13 member 5 isoform X2 [Mastomys coucha]